MGEASARRDVLTGPAVRGLLVKILDRAELARLAIDAGNSDGAYDAVLQVLGWTSALARKLAVHVDVGPLPPADE